MAHGSHGFPSQCTCLENGIQSLGCLAPTLCPLSLVLTTLGPHGSEITQRLCFVTTYFTHRAWCPQGPSVLQHLWGFPALFRLNSILLSGWTCLLTIHLQVDRWVASTVSRCE